ncbi:c-type cytochrome [Desulfosporosinus sp. SYSU MS00001]|uniref:c-type cytochrome n=1 Tax=Desulfosporosinus sp. SYSU MS00001 TaxID=3416284 RepID=UPI003CFA9C7F
MKNFKIICLLLGIMVIGAGCATKPTVPTNPTDKNTQVRQSVSKSSSTNSNTTSAPTPPSSTPTSTGKDIYDKNCAACHGPAGAGGSARALNTETRSQNEVSNTIRNGKGSMPGFGSSLSVADIQAVSEYVAGLKK